MNKMVHLAVALNLFEVNCIKPKLWERVTRRFINGFGMQALIRPRWEGIPLYLLPRY